MNIIIVGCGKIGRTLTEQLCKEGHDISIIDEKKELVENIANKFDVLGVIGNGASYTTQVDAGIEGADLLIATTGMDELNLLCCLIARKIGKCHTISRVRNPVYGREIGIIKEELGLSMIVNPEQAAAMEIARLLRFPSAIKIDTFDRGRIELLKFKIKQGSKLDGYRLMDISTKLKCDVLVCTVERGDEIRIPNGQFLLQGNDVISIVAVPKKAGEFFIFFCLGTTKVKNTMLVGGGRISFYLTKELLHMGIQVTIVEKNRARCEELSLEYPEVLIINGDGIDRNLLCEEGIERVESFAALTNMDEENILLSLYAKHRSNAKLITKVHRVELDDVILEMDLGSIICPKNIVAEHIIRYVRAMENSARSSNIETLYKIIENKAEALEFIIRERSAVTDVPLEKLNIKDGVIIASIKHKGNIVIPKGQDVIREGDSVIVVTIDSEIDDIADILKN